MKLVPYLVFIVLTLIIHKIMIGKKVYINDFYYCTKKNKLHIKTILIPVCKNQTYFHNVKRMLKDFDKLPQNKIFKCLTHEVIVKHLIQESKRGTTIKEITYKKSFIYIWVTSIEWQMGKKENFSGFKRAYKVTIKT